MTDRILDISDAPAKLSVRLDQLVIETEERRTTAPLDDLAAVVVSHPRVTYSQAVLAGLAESGGAFLVCDKRRLPVAMLLPLDAHGTQTERIGQQVALSGPRRKRLWQQIARAKIAAQARVLVRLRGDDDGIAGMAARVGSGDPQNVEAQAARRYWPLLFADPGFRRNRDAEDQNRYLNYGYAVVRALVARAVCAVGLHPSVGIHHHNRYDTFCLADDLLEPFRPLVDEAAARIVQERGGDAPLDRSVKESLLELTTARYEVEGEKRTLFDALARLAWSLADVCEGRERRLNLPAI